MKGRIIFVLLLLSLFLPGCADTASQEQYPFNETDHYIEKTGYWVHDAFWDLYTFLIRMPKVSSVHVSCPEAIDSPKTVSSTDSFL